MSGSIVWFRQDLRVRDNPALTAAIVRQEPVIPVYILDPAGEGEWPLGSCSRWWLHHSLTRLQQQCAQLGSPLIVRSGNAAEALEVLLHETQAQAVFWNRRYEPAVMARDRAIEEAFQSQGFHVESFNGSLLIEPDQVRTKQGKPFQVFTPFWKACLPQLTPSLQPSPKRLIPPPRTVPSLSIANLNLLPHIPWDAQFPNHWKPGEEGAMSAFIEFLAHRVDVYQSARDFPGQAGTSALSPHLHFGEISPQRLLHGLLMDHPETPGARTFLTELGWREFAHHILYHFPLTPHQPLRESFQRFPWQDAPVHLRAWQKGQTGYPIVDAGMRELWATGWMHNRVRMIVGSFLTKDLLIPWQQGARWFWDTLLDADLANNTLGWQWISGCGADAAPYFRIFNPVSQGEKFDPEGGYVRQWCPELAHLPNAWIHHPWNAPPQVLKQAGVTLGENYPDPIVDHSEARRVALASFAQIRK